MMRELNDFLAQDLPEVANVTGAVTGTLKFAHAIGSDERKAAVGLLTVLRPPLVLSCADREVALSFSQVFFFARRVGKEI